jgi:thioredoxin-related protein
VDAPPEKIAANPELAQLMKLKNDFGVSGFPTVVLLDPQGKELVKVSGYGGQPPSAFLAKFKSPIERQR